MTKPLVTILDDEPAIRTMLADALEDAGFRTIGFGRAREFEAALKHQTPDVCLVDLSLPDTDGLTVVHKLALEKGAIVIIISGARQGAGQSDRTGTGGRMITSSNPSIRPKSWPASGRDCDLAKQNHKAVTQPSSTDGWPISTAIS